MVPILAVPLLLLLLLLGAIHSLRMQTQAGYWVMHSEEIRLATSRLLATTVDAETGQRGYLVTNDRRFLEPYERAIERWHGELDDLRQLAQSNPGQLRRIDELERLIGLRFQLLALTGRGNQGGAPDPALAADMLRGKDAMDDLRRVLSEIDQEEARLLIERTEASERQRRWTFFLLIGGTSTFALVVAGIWAERRRTEAQRKQLDFVERFIGVLGHDLRNPLNSILMGAQLLQRSASERDRKTAERIVRSAERMTRMIEQILDLARSRLGKGIPLERKPCNLRDLVTNIVDEMQAAHPDHAFKWTGNAACEGSWDSDRLGQVISNLLGNALEHGDRATPVEVSMRSTPQVAELSVWNLGPPIPSEMLGTIFDPYSQGTRQTKSGGLGLGLFISKEIVEAHGGRITVQSSSEAGTVFRVVLPRNQPPRERPSSMVLSRSRA